MTDLFARVARRANIGGLPIGAEAIQEIDRLLFEERLATIKRGVKREAPAQNGAGGAALEGQGPGLTDHDIARHGGSGL